MIAIRLEAIALKSVHSTWLDTLGGPRVAT